MIFNPEGLAHLAGTGLFDRVTLSLYPRTVSAATKQKHTADLYHVPCISQRATAAVPNTAAAVIPHPNRARGSTDRDPTAARAALPDEGLLHNGGA